MRYEILNEGWAVRTGSLTSGRVAAGARLALLPGGELLCSCMFQDKLGQNDFVPMLFHSPDGGQTWRERGAIWPHLQSTWSIFANISNGADGRLFLFGSRTPIDSPGEPFWSEATQGLKQNELIWADSRDGGKTWRDPQPIPMPIPGAAEAPGALQVLKSGRWIAPYSPYRTFDPNVEVDRGQTVAVFSDDQGKTWRHTAMIRFAEPESSSAEAWLVEVAPNRLLGTAWHIDLAGKTDYPDAFAMSSDGGTSWSATRSTGIQGQSTALAKLADGRALFIYNQRKQVEIGVWLAVVRPTETEFQTDLNALIWKAPTRTRSGTSGDHAEWTDFSFGEPAITALDDGTLVAVLWCIQPDGRGIRFVRLRIAD